ncbi:hypothetical protein MPU07_000009 [Staphylococcus pseudintermedius]|nr:hypothetical protein [Staphylococcus pseudintermedius]EIZ4620805.1 hypothetical protein [Staphylococcus pseudintermedius]MDK4184263.1 hypothetical protein [Staphylococcus pseudintermedius]HAR5756215.1 hypothetical protein [Staphylococcus pseudintermedius]HCT0378246.1 hypothetical protein [Staphylococcus pseudintermedius]
MNRLIFLLFASLLVLSACGNEEEKKAPEKKSEQKEENKTKEKNVDKDKKNKEVKANLNVEEDNSKVKDEQFNNKIDVNNITDRKTLESVIYGNYTEMDKIHAYNSAVTNGIIPQGNVMEGPATAAYESSLRIEKGQEQSIYEQNTNGDLSEEEAQRMSDLASQYNEEVAKHNANVQAHNDWINGQVEWSNASESEKEAIRKRDAEKYGYEYNPEDYE